jgi:hypothetical protein
VEGILFERKETSMSDKIGENTMSEESRKIRLETEGRDEKGRFGAGNPGRPPGSKNRTTAVAQALLAEEETELLRKGIELAKAGDVQMLKFLLDRILPKERLIQIDIPQLDVVEKAVDGMAAINSGIAEGRITPSEGAALSSMIASYARTIEVRQLSNRVEAIEHSLIPKEEK